MDAAILDFRLAATPAAANPEKTTPTKAKGDLPRLVVLDRVSTRRRRLVCHWQRDADGRLFAKWVPDTIDAGGRR